MQTNQDELDSMEVCNDTELEIERRKRKKSDSDPRSECLKRSRRDSQEFRSNNSPAEPRPYNQMALMFDVYKNYMNINWTLKTAHEEKLARAKAADSSSMDLENTYYVWQISDETNDY